MGIVILADGQPGEGETGKDDIGCLDQEVAIGVEFPGALYKEKVTDDKGFQQEAEDEIIPLLPGAQIEEDGKEIEK